VTENAIYGTNISFEKDGGHPQKVGWLVLICIIFLLVLRSVWFF